jgi:hypothetical protein
MRIWTIATALSLILAAGTVGQAQAAGCLKGAVVGGVAGHLAGHGVLGAAGGCVVGHHMAAKQANQERAQQANPQQYRNP